ncbi:PPC domain-containing DNA-binding protein [Roseomonas gilardii]|uniref:PPC domain-containing DNA-binding protein n=1 Tax=Roseomonas gilardii TaxID=257708 RepID=UPI0011A2F831|nr:PPC domain-containing DNA-binding protein [Roseomonas gilardii]
MRNPVLGVAACCGLAIGMMATALAQTRPGYTVPGPVTDRDKAPQMQVREVSTQPDGTRNYVIIFGKGDHVMSGLTEWAQEAGIGGAHLTAIGAFSSAHFGWFEKDRKAYRDILVNQQNECIGLIGDIGLVNGKPALHVHGSVGLPDGSVRGGHLIEAVAWPTLEVFVTVPPHPLVKHEDAETSLDLFALDAAK